MVFSPPQSHPEYDLLGLAVRVAEGIMRDYRPPDPNIASHGSLSLASDLSLYSGSAGTALYLCELAVHRPALRGAAEEWTWRTLRCAQALLDAHPARNASRDPVGLYVGRVGIAYLAHRAASALQAPKMHDAAQHVLRSVAACDVSNVVFDVYQGLAGAIAPLLLMGDTYSAEITREPAMRFGRELVLRATTGRDGWSWHDQGRPILQPLTGMAHGAAGAGHALLLLHRATGQSVYRHAAEQAYRYEQNSFSPEHANWPDYRHRGLSRALHRQDSATLRRSFLRGELPLDETASYLNAWCHGAPGIGLTRAYAATVIDGGRYRASARVAARTTAQSLRPSRNESKRFCLCHGQMGNAMLLESMAVAARLPDARDWAQDAVLRIADQVDQSGLHAYTPSLMTGAAGVGYALLYFSKSTVPNILALGTRQSLVAELNGGDVPAPPSVPPLVSPTTFSRDNEASRVPQSSFPGLSTADVSRRVVRTHFAHSLHAWEQHMGTAWPLPDSASGLHGTLLQFLRDVRSLPDHRGKEQIRDALRLEVSRYRKTCGPKNYARALAREHAFSHPLAPDAFDSGMPLLHRDDHVRMTPSAGFVRCRWDWTARFRSRRVERSPTDAASSGASEGRADPPEKETIYVVYSDGRGGRMQRIAPNEQAVFERFRTPDTLSNLVDHLRNCRTSRQKAARISQRWRDVWHMLRAGLLEAESRKAGGSL